MMVNLCCLLLVDPVLNVLSLSFLCNLSTVILCEWAKKVIPDMQERGAQGGLWGWTPRPQSDLRQGACGHLLG